MRAPGAWLWRTLIVVVFAAPPAHAANVPSSPDTGQLLQEALGARAQLAEQRAERERRFEQELDARQLRLSEAQQMLAREQARGDELHGRFDQQRQALAAARARLEVAAQDIADLRAQVPDIARSLDGMTFASPTSAVNPERSRGLVRIAQARSFPDFTALEQIWHEALGEMVHGGEIARFDAQVIDVDGRGQQREITRVGVFSLLADGKLLRFEPDSRRLVMPLRQPAIAAGDVDGSLPVAAIDPTRGTLLALESRRPTILDRLRQAGPVGYLIVALGGLALVVFGERALRLVRIQRRIVGQQAADVPNQDNPLGRLRLVERRCAHIDGEALGAVLDEALLAEIPVLKGRLPLLSVFATAAPLLGLLGTVAGMIDTFQAMTLFGSGDPKFTAGGISMALVATELGLIVAIPILLLHAWLHGISTRIIDGLEREIAALVVQREEGQHAVVVHRVG